MCDTLTSQILSFASKVNYNHDESPQSLLSLNFSRSHSDKEYRKYEAGCLNLLFQRRAMVIPDGDDELLPSPLRRSAT